MIRLIKDSNADSRSTDVSQLQRDDLKIATERHQDAVRQAMKFMASLAIKAGDNHDWLKTREFENFYQSLISGKIKDSEWYKDHIEKERHHLKSNVPDDVNLIDVIEHIVDCTMAGLGRTGEVYDDDLPAYVLEKACKNTVELLKQNTQVVSLSSDNEEDLMDTKLKNE